MTINILPKQRIQRLILLIVAIIFVALPFTTPITVFLGSNLNHFGLFKVWKEITMIFVACLVLSSGIMNRFFNIKQNLFRILLWLIVAYGVWTILLGIVNLLMHQINWEAFLYALIVNLRFLFFFLLCWLVTRGDPFLATHWKKLVLIPAAIVIVFGLLQHFVLPANFLEHIGYGPDTITAYQTVDQKPDYVRVQSTLRGPNPLGAYLIVIIAVIVAALQKFRWQQISMTAGALVVMFYSYSRSAWIGLAASVAAFSYISIPSSTARKKLVIVALAVALIFAGGAYLGRNNSVVENTLFHTDSTSQSPESSNEGRARAIQQGITDVVHEPLGRGPGSAGPASLRNDGHAERISENYYLQIGQELGWIGLLLFLAINAVIAVLLWQKRDSLLARILLACLVGITVVNLLSHAWTDDTLALLWWGLAGIALAPTISNRKQDKIAAPATGRQSITKMSK